MDHTKPSVFLIDGVISKKNGFTIIDRDSKQENPIYNGGMDQEKQPSSIKYYDEYKTTIKEISHMERESILLPTHAHTHKYTN